MFLPLRGSSTRKTAAKVLTLKSTLSVTLAGIVSCTAVVLSSTTLAVEPAVDQIGRILMAENTDNGVQHQPMPIAGDATFLRRVYVDLIGRIPTTAEIRQFAEMPQQTRRAALVDELLSNNRFADTTVRSRNVHGVTTSG